MATTEKKGVVQVVLDYLKGFGVLKKNTLGYWGVQGVNVLDCTAYFALMIVITIFLSKELGFSDVEAGYIVTVLGLATSIALFFSGSVTDWLGIRWSFYVALGVKVPVTAAICGLAITKDVPHKNAIVLVLIVLLAMTMAMVQTTLQAANKRFTTKSSRAVGFNFWYLFMNVGAAFGGISVDVVRKTLELSTTYVMAFAIVTSVLSMIACTLLIRNEKQAYDEDERGEAAVKGVEKKREMPWTIFFGVIRDVVFWKLAALLTLLLGVRAVFLHMGLIMPKYWTRVIGEDANIGLLNTINPILIVGGLLLFTPIAGKFKVYKMLMVGAAVSAMSLFVMALPWRVFGSDVATSYYIMAIVAMVFLSFGEILWSPKLCEYTAAIAPKGREGAYLGLSLLPWFVAKTAVSVLSGHMLTRWCPEGMGERIRAGIVAYWDSPEAMWLILGIWAIGGVVIAVFLGSWFTKGVDYGKDAKEAKVEG